MEPKPKHTKNYEDPDTGWFMNPMTRHHGPCVSIPQECPKKPGPQIR